MFDLAVGVLGIPLFIFFLANSIDGIPNCVAASLARRLMIAPIGGSSIVLFAVTVERYYCHLTSLYIQDSCDERAAFEVRGCPCDNDSHHGPVFCIDTACSSMQL